MRPQLNPLKLIERVLEERQASHNDILYGGFESAAESALRFRIQHGNQHCYAICTRTDDPRACYIVFRSIEANTRLRWPEGDVDRFLEQFNTAVDAIWLGGKFFREQGEVRYRATIDRVDNMSANAIVDFLMEKTRSLIA